jgi:WD40 repeat protein
LSTSALRAIDFSPQRNELAIGASDHAIYLLDATDLSLKQQIIRAHDNSVFCVQYSQDEQCLYSGGRDAQLKVWELGESARGLLQKAAHWYTINDLALSPNGDFLATGSRDKRIRIWRTSDFELIKTLDTIHDQGHVNSVNRLLWLPGGELISAGDDRRLIVWEAAATPKK